MKAFHDEVTAMGPALLAFAQRLAPEQGEAERLVGLVIGKALAPGAEKPGAQNTAAWLFALMRSAFHSVERRRPLNRTQRVADRPWNVAQAAIYVQHSRTPA